MNKGILISEKKLYFNSSSTVHNNYKGLTGSKGILAFKINMNREKIKLLASAPSFSKKNSLVIWFKFLLARLLITLDPAYFSS